MRLRRRSGLGDDFNATAFTAEGQAICVGVFEAPVDPGSLISMAICLHRPDGNVSATLSGCHAAPHSTSCRTGISTRVAAASNSFKHDGVRSPDALRQSRGELLSRIESVVKTHDRYSPCFRCRRTTTLPSPDVGNTVRVASGTKHFVRERSCPILSHRRCRAMRGHAHFSDSGQMRRPLVSASDFPSRQAGSSVHHYGVRQQENTSREVRAESISACQTEGTYVPSTI